MWSFSKTCLKKHYKQEAETFDCLLYEMWLGMNEDNLKRLAELSKQDIIISSPVRLSIMILLYLNKKFKFSSLQKALNLTPGNLASHLKKLSDKGYIKIKKTFIELKPATIIMITEEGARKLREVIGELKAVLEEFEKKTTSEGK